MLRCANTPGRMTILVGNRYDDLRAAKATTANTKGISHKVERVEQNGVRRPGPGLCLPVWRMSTAWGSLRPLLLLCASRGTATWNTDQ